jgi:hypothetical protein
MKIDDGWPNYSKLVMANLEDHEDRIKALEAGMEALKMDMVRMMMRYSVMGTLATSVVVILTAVASVYFGK